MQTALLAMLFSGVFGATWLLSRTLLPDQALRRLQNLTRPQAAPVAAAAP
jgi:hypothetical protein